MKQNILQNLNAACPWSDTLHWYDTIDSTNLRARELAKAGAPQGTVVMAGTQSKGRGRLGRSFASPTGQGIYMSVVLRPGCKPEALMHLTCAVGVAVCNAVEEAVGIRPGLKWINDLVWGKQKLGGILTELSVDPKTGLVEYAVVGIGINCLEKPEDFPPELQNMATSLQEAAGREVSIPTVAAAMLWALSRLADRLLPDRPQLMARYKADCITLGKEIQVLRGEERSCGKALDVLDDGALLVAFSDGRIQPVNAGEVSVRGMYGYL